MNYEWFLILIFRINQHFILNLTNSYWASFDFFNFIINSFIKNLFRLFKHRKISFSPFRFQILILSFPFLNFFSSSWPPIRINIPIKSRIYIQHFHLTVILISSLILFFCWILNFLNWFCLLRYFVTSCHSSFISLFIKNHTVIVRIFIFIKSSTIFNLTKVNFLLTTFLIINKINN